MEQLTRYPFIRTTLLLVGLSIVASLASVTYKNFQSVNGGSDIPTTISVSGTGEVIAIPDIAEFTYMVEAEGESSAAVQAQAAEVGAGIIAYLEESGLAESDIKTTSYNLSPQYRWEERLCVPGQPCGPGERVQTGFSVQERVSVRVRNVDQAGSILSGVGERGAEQISGLNFVVDDRDALHAEARALAIANARKEAAAIAEQLGVELGDVAGFYELRDEYNRPMMRSMEFVEADVAAEPRLAVGEETVAANVEVQFHIR